MFYSILKFLVTIDEHKKYYGERIEFFGSKNHGPQEAKATIEKYYRKAFPSAKSIKITLISRNFITFQQYAAFLGDTAQTFN